MVDDEYEFVWLPERTPDTPEARRLHMQSESTKNAAKRLRIALEAAWETHRRSVCEEYVYRTELYETGCEHVWEVRPEGEEQCRGICRGVRRKKPVRKRQGGSGG